MWIVYTALGIAGIDIATAKQYGSIQGSWECINRSFTSCDILCKCLLMNVRLDHSILISLPLVHDHKYVISLTVLIHTITSAGSVWQINAKSATASLIANLRVLQLASLSKSVSNAETWCLQNGLRPSSSGWRRTTSSTWPSTVSGNNSNHETCRPLETRRSLLVLQILNSMYNK